MSKGIPDQFLEGNAKFCTFYMKTGCCRHGDRCSRRHIKPAFSTTLTIPHVYIPPAGTTDDEPFFEEFVEDFVRGLSKFGYVEDFAVFENLGEHMKGNVVVRFATEAQAAAALSGISGRHFAGVMLTPELSPVSDFRDARCRDYEAKGCALGGVCNFVHFRGFPRWLTEAVGAYSERGYAVPARGESGGAGGRDRGGERGDYGRSGPARGGGGGGGGGGYDDRRGGRDRSDRDGGRDRARGYDRGDRERGDRERGGDRYRGRSRSPPRGDGGRDRRDRDGGRGREAYHDDRSSGGGSSGGGDRDRYRGTDFERDRERDRERGRDDGWDRPVEP